jgi:hypothetical protein
MEMASTPQAFPVCLGDTVRITITFIIWGNGDTGGLQPIFKLHGHGIATCLLTIQQLHAQQQARIVVFRCGVLDND